MPDWCSVYHGRNNIYIIRLLSGYITYENMIMEVCGMPIYNAKIRRFFMIAGVTAGVYLMIRYLLPLAAPFVFSYAIFCLLRPVSHWIEKQTKLPARTTGVILIVLTIGIMTFIVYTAGRLLCRNLYQWMNRGQFFRQELLVMGQDICCQIDGWLGCPQGRTWQVAASAIAGWQAASQEKLYSLFANGMVAFVQGLARFGVILLIGFIGAVLLMRHQYALLNDIKENYFYKEIRSIFGRVSEVAGSFIKTQSVIMGAMALACAVGIFLLRMEHPVLMGIAIAVLDAFPILGSGMILVPWAVIRLMKGAVMQAIGLLIIYVVTVCIRELLEPKLMGTKLNIHPFYMLMATVIGVQLFGFWGIFTGPLALVMIREILEQIQ